MSFYGNITNTARSPFTFDHIYSSRYAMEQNMTSDGVYAGRYVLVEYDKDFSNREFHRAYRDASEDREETHILYKDSNCTIPVMVRQNPGEIDAPEVGSIFYTVENSVYVSQLFWMRGSDVPKVGSNHDAEGQNFYIIVDGEKCYFNVDDVATNGITLLSSNQSNNSLIQVFAIVQNGYAFFECQGSHSQGENEDEPEDFTANFRYLSLAQTTAAPGTIENYLSNHTLDTIYYKRPQGYDSTVWQKIYVDEEEKYIMIADLNTQAPTITISADAPSSQPTPPHFDPSSTNTMYDLHEPTQWGFRVKAADRTLSEGGMILDSATGQYLPFFEQTARYIDTAFRALAQAESDYYNATTGAKLTFDTNYASYQSSIATSLQQLDPVPDLPVNFYTKINALLASYDDKKFFLDPDNPETNYFQLQTGGDGIPTADYNSVTDRKIGFFSFLTDDGNILPYSLSGGADVVFENLVEAIFYDWYTYQTAFASAQSIYDNAIETLKTELYTNVQTIALHVIDPTEANQEKLSTYLDVVLNAVSSYEKDLAAGLGMITADISEKVSVLNSKFTILKKANLDIIDELEYDNTYVKELLILVVNELYDDYASVLISSTEDEDGTEVAVEPLTTDLIEIKNVKAIEDINYYLRQVINTSLLSDTDATWLNIQNNQRYYFDGITATWKDNSDSVVAADIYFNKKGFDSNKRSKDNTTENTINITPTGYGQHYNPETKAWETYKYNVEDRTVYGEKTESPDTQELSIHLPGIGNAISDVWDLTYGQSRNKDIAWESKDPNKLQLTVENPDGSGFTYTPSQVETIAGVINSTQNLMGKIIVENPEGKDASGEFADSNDVYNLLDDDHIYYFTQDGGYYRRAWSYDFTKIPDNEDENDDHIISNRVQYNTKVKALNPVELVNPYNIPRNLEQEYSEYSLAYTYDANETYYRKDGDEYIEIPNNNLLVFEPGVYYIHKPTGTYYYKDGENYYWDVDYQSGKKYYLIESKSNPFAPKVNEFRRRTIDVENEEFSEYDWSKVSLDPLAHILVSEADFTWGGEYFDLSSWQDDETVEKWYLWQPNKYYTRELMEDEEGNPVQRLVNGELEDVYLYTLRSTYQGPETEYFLKTKNAVTSVEFNEETQEYQYYVEQAAQYSSAIRVGQIGDGYEYYISKEDLFNSLLTRIEEGSEEERVLINPFYVETVFTSSHAAGIEAIGDYTAAIRNAYNVAEPEGIDIGEGVILHRATIGEPTGQVINDFPVTFDGYLEVLDYVDNTTADNAFVENGELVIEPPCFYRVSLDEYAVTKYQPNGYYYKNTIENNVVGYILDTSEEGSEEREYVTLKTHPISFKVYEPGKYYYPINDFDYRFILAPEQPIFTQVPDSSALSNANFNVYTYYEKDGDDYIRSVAYQAGTTYYTSPNFGITEYYIHNTGDNSVEAPYVRAYVYNESETYYIKEYDTTTMDYAVSLLPAVDSVSIQKYVPRQVFNSFDAEDLAYISADSTMSDYYYRAWSDPIYETKYRLASPQPTNTTYTDNVYYVETGEDSYTHPSSYDSQYAGHYYVKYTEFTADVNNAPEVYINLENFLALVARKKEQGEIDSNLKLLSIERTPYKYTAVSPQLTQEQYEELPEKYFVRYVDDNGEEYFEHPAEYNSLKIYYTQTSYFVDDSNGMPVLYNSDDYEYIQCTAQSTFEPATTYYTKSIETIVETSEERATQEKYTKVTNLAQATFEQDPTVYYTRTSLGGQAEYVIIYKGYNAYDENLTYYEHTPYYVTNDYLEYKAGQKWDWSVNWENYALSITDTYFEDVDYFVDNEGQIPAKFYKKDLYYFKYEPDIYYTEDTSTTYYKIADGAFVSNTDYYYDREGQVPVKFYEPNKYYYESIGSITKDSSNSLSNSKLYYLDKNGHEQIFFETYEANNFYYGQPATTYTLDSRTYFDESATYYQDVNGTKTAITLTPYYPNMYYTLQPEIAEVYNPTETYYTAAEVNNANATGSTLSQYEFEKHTWYTRTANSVDEYSRAGYFDANETYYIQTSSNPATYSAATGSSAPTAQTDFVAEDFFIKRTVTNYTYTQTNTYNAATEYYLKLSPTSVTQNATYVYVGTVTQTVFNNTDYYTRKFILCDDNTVDTTKTYYRDSSGTVVVGNLYRPNTYYIQNNVIQGVLDSASNATNGREYYYDEFLENRVYLTTSYAANKFYSATVSYVLDTGANITPYRVYYLTNNASTPIRLEVYYPDRFYMVDNATHYHICTDENVDPSKTYYTDLRGSSSITFDNSDYTLARGNFVSGATYYTRDENTYTPITLYEYQPNMYFTSHGDNAAAIQGCRLVSKDYLERLNPDGVPLFKIYYLKFLEGFARDYNTIHGLILKLNQWMDNGNVTTRDLETIQGALNALQDQIRRLGAYDYSTIYNLNNTVNMIALKAEELIADIEALNAEVAAQGGYATKNYVLDNFLLKHHPGDDSDTYVEQTVFDAFSGNVYDLIGTKKKSALLNKKSIKDNLKDLDNKIGTLKTSSYKNLPASDKAVAYYLHNLYGKINTLESSFKTYKSDTNASLKNIKKGVKNMFRKGEKGGPIKVDFKAVPYNTKAYKYMNVTRNLSYYYPALKMLYIDVAIETHTTKKGSGLNNKYNAMPNGIAYLANSKYNISVSDMSLSISQPTWYERTYNARIEKTLNGRHGVLVVTTTKNFNKNTAYGFRFNGWVPCEMSQSFPPELS